MLWQMVRLVAHDWILWHTRNVKDWRITWASVIAKGAWGQRARLGSCEDNRRHSRKVPSCSLLEEARRPLLPFFPTPRRHVSSFLTYSYPRMFVEVHTTWDSEMAWQVPMPSLCAEREIADVTWSK